eukprot:5663274-Pleurochrysis_carterae.AAC.1
MPTMGTLRRWQNGRSASPLCGMKIAMSEVDDAWQQRALPRKAQHPYIRAPVILQASTSLSPPRSKLSLCS